MIVYRMRFSAYNRPKDSRFINTERTIQDVIQHNELRKVQKGAFGSLPPHERTRNLQELVDVAVPK